MGLQSGSTNTVDANGNNVLVATETTLASIDTKIVTVDTSSVTVISSTLPSGASTSALQVSGNASLASIDSKLTSPILVTGPLTDAQLRATPVPISGTVTANAGTGTFQVNVTNATLAVTQSGAWSVGRTWTLSSGTDSVASVQSGTWTVQPGNTANTTPWLTTISQGGNSAAVTVSNALKVDGSAVTQPISGTVTANAGTNLNTSALALETTQLAQNTLIGAVNETAPSTDTASSGLNGRLQRIAQRLTSLIALFPSVIGQTTKAGSLSVTLASDQNNSTNATEGTVSPGTAATKSELAGGIYNSPAPTVTNGQQVALQTDSSGNLKVNIVNGTINVVPVGTLATYSAAVSLLTVASSPTDVFLIKGSATKIIQVDRLFFSGVQTNASTIDLLLIKRSADNTGGTRTAATNVPHDSTDSAATAQVFSYTANPSALGTAVGTVRAIAVNIPNKNSAVSINSGILELSQPPQKPIVLNNANEYLAINLNATSIAGSSLDITVDWTEQ